MVKKIYSKPEITVKKVETQTHLLVDSYSINNTTVSGSDGGWAKEDDFDMGDEWQAPLKAPPLTEYPAALAA